LGHDDIDFEPNQLRGELGPALASTVGPPKLEDDVLPLDVTEIVQALTQGLSLQVGKEEADAGDLCRGLPFGGERRRERANHRRQQEAAAVHYCSENRSVSMRNHYHAVTAGRRNHFHVAGVRVARMGYSMT